MTAEIRVGTSGYYFKDWVGTVYPKGLSSRDYLSHYAASFDTVEINTTYYRIPEPGMFEGMLSKTPEDFVFVVKAPREMTHERHKLSSAEAPFLAAIAPLIREGKLGGILAQFPYPFKANAQSIEHLKRVADTFVGRDIPTNVEFRHDSWYRDEMFGELRSLGLGFVNVDLPKLAHLPRPSSIATSDIAYFRLHGRNQAMWFTHPTPSHRYDYVYADDELEAWAKHIKEIAAQVRRVFVFNNNCHLGSSFIDALKMKPLLGLSLPQPQTQDGGLFAPPSAEEQIKSFASAVANARQAEKPALDEFLRNQRNEAESST